jgi:hypothetical protein
MANVGRAACNKRITALKDSGERLFVTNLSQLYYSRNTSCLEEPEIT